MVMGGERKRFFFALAVCRTTQRAQLLTEVHKQRRKEKKIFFPFLLVHSLFLIPLLYPPHHHNHRQSACQVSVNASRSRECGRTLSSSFNAATSLISEWYVFSTFPRLHRVTFDCLFCPFSLPSSVSHSSVGWYLSLFLSNRVWSLEVHSPRSSRVLSMIS